MTSKTRIYEVHVEEITAQTFLIEASSQAEARKHVRDKYIGNATLPSGKRIAELMESGLKVKTATE